MVAKVILGIVLAGIAYLSLTPVPDLNLGDDKIGHLIAYAVLTINLGVLIDPYLVNYVIIGLTAFAYGLLMEALQYYIPGREVSFLDVLANAGGVIIGLLVVFLLGKTLRGLLKKARII